MESENFFSRWSRRKSDGAEQPSDLAPVAGSDIAAADDPDTPPLTLDDVAKLTPESDFTPFMAGSVDAGVRRSAMKKLFADPHFNVMDGLDIYVGDYHTFEPIPPEMLAILNHAQALLNPLAHLETPLMRLLESKPDEPAETVPDSELLAQADAAVPAEGQANPATIELSLPAENTPDADPI